MLSRAFAQADPNDLQEDPTGLGDARTSPGFSIQATAGYRRDAQNNVFGFEPQIQYSRSNWYAQVSYLLAAGPGGRRNAGDVRFQLFRQLNEEKGAVPMFAVLAVADVPSGIMSAGLDTRLQVNVSKTIGAAATDRRVHLNAGWFHNAGRRGDERSNLYRIAAGYSQRLGRNAVVIADYSSPGTEGARERREPAGTGLPHPDREEHHYRDRRRCRHTEPAGQVTGRPRPGAIVLKCKKKYVLARRTVR